jgi:thioredoxin 1
MRKIFYFTSLGCVPCQTLSPIMDRVSKEIPVEKITTDYEIDRARAANVSSVPTVVLTQDGQEIRRFVGVKSYEQIMQFING